MANIVDNFTTLKEKLIKNRDDLKNTLINKGVNCTDKNKISQLIQEVSSLRPKSLSWLGKKGSWTSGKASNMYAGTYYASSCSINNNIYVIGGAQDQQSSVQKYNVGTNTWESFGSLGKASIMAGVTNIGNDIYIIGSNSNTYAQVSNGVFNILTKTYTSLKDRPVACYGAFTEAVGDNIYSIAGFGSSDNLSSTANYCYNTKTNTWSTKQSIPHVSAMGGSFVYDNKVYCLSGKNSSNHEYYNTATNTWTSVTSWDKANAYFGFTFIDNKFYCVGGNEVNSQNACVRYDVIKDSWETLANYPDTRYGLCCGNAYGYLFAMGGYDSQSTTYNKTYVYEII